MITSQHADIFTLVAPTDYTTSNTKGNRLKAILKKVGFVQSLREETDFGTTQTNVIGNPFSMITPGYMSTTISLEKVTIDGNDFRNAGSLNPLWAFADIYTKANLIDVSNYSNKMSIDDDDLLPFVFILAVRDRISKSFSQSNISNEQINIGNSEKRGSVEYVEGSGKPESDTTKRKSSLLGTYACVLKNASSALTVQQSIIIENMTALARPLSGAWLNKAVKDALTGVNVANANKEEYNNGFKNLTSLLYGYAISDTEGADFPR